MKRLLISVLCILHLILFSTGIVYAGNAAQETGEIDIFSAVGIISQLMSASAGAAATQIMTGEASLPTALPEAEPTEEPPAPPSDGLPVLFPEQSDKTAPVSENSGLPVIPGKQPVEEAPLPAGDELPDIPEEQPAEPDTLPEITGHSHTAEEQHPDAPADPEAVSVSTGITVKDFHDAFKSNVKESGRHSVSFEEKGKKSSSKITVDDDIELFLRYSKEGGTSVINRITFTGKSSGGSAKTIFTIMMQTLCDFLNIGFDEGEGYGIYEAVAGGGSLVYSDLLVYGEPGQKELNIQVYYTGSGYVEPSTTTYSQSADDEFHALIEDLRNSGAVPDSNGSYYFHEDYQQEWAQINWLKGQPFDTAKNFVISADISWLSASRTPNYSESGCGFIMRELDSSNYLFASLRLDGRLYLGGLKKGSRLSYGNYGFGSYSYKGEAQLVLVANENKLTAYVDGARVGKQQDVIVDDIGNLAFTVWSGTNKDYGIRCTFRNVFYYVW